MNDFITPILKLLSALVSPRAAIRYILVGSALLVSWVKLKPYIDPFGLPAQISGLTCSLIGIGVGTVVSALLFLIFDSIISIYNSINLIAKKIKSDQYELSVKKEKEDAFSELFKENIHHFDSSSIRILKTLCKGDKPFSTNTRYVLPHEIQALEGLFANGIILKSMNIDNKTNVYAINPLLKNWLMDFFDNEARRQVSDYLQFSSASQRKALELLEGEDNTDTPPRPFPMDLMVANSHYSPCLECTASDDIEESFYFEFRDDYRIFFEQITSKKYKESVEVYGSQS